MAEVKRIIVRRCQHYAGARPTRVTYYGGVEYADGRKVLCGHLHRTVDTAGRCGERQVAPR